MENKFLELFMVVSWHVSQSFTFPLSHQVERDKSFQLHCRGGDDDKKAPKSNSGGIA